MITAIKPADDHDAEGNELGTDGITQNVFDAAGKLVRNFTDDSNDNPIYGSGFYYDGLGRSIESHHPTNTNADVVLFLRSTVFGNEIVSEASVSGRKVKTYVKGNGEVLAVQNYNDTPSSVEVVVGDPSGASVRSVGKYANSQNPSVRFFGAEEMDPAGRDASTINPYVSEEEPPEEEDPDPDLDEFHGNFFGGDVSEYAINGMRVSLETFISTVADSQSESYFIFSSRLRPYDYVDAFRFQGSEGKPFDVPPDVSGERLRELIIKYGEPDLVYARDWVRSLVISKAESEKPQPRRVNDLEKLLMRESITRAADNTSMCRTYIKDLIEKAAANAGLSDQIVSTNVEALLSIVLASRGDPAFGNGGGIFIGPPGPHYAKNNWALVNARGFAEIEFGWLERLLPNVISEGQSGMSIIHELMHVAIRGLRRDSNDVAYANAAADLAGEARPTFDPNAPDGINGQSSTYWDARLSQACGFPASSGPMVGKMTNYKLYR